MHRGALLDVALLFSAGALFIAWDQPQPDPDIFRGNPCDGSNVRACIKATASPLLHRYILPETPRVP